MSINYIKSRVVPMRTSKKLILCVSVLLALTLSGCNTLSVNDDTSAQISNDPLQGLNRKIYGFNNGVDKAIVKPIAKGYDAVLPTPAKIGVHNFFTNLGEPFNIVNNLLQAKFDRALGSTYRFLVNSTIGIGGLIDVAGYYEVEETREDLGQTLAAWGVKPGPYIMLPFLGPTNLRDGVGFFGERFVYFPNDEITDSDSVEIGLTVLQIIDTRVGLFGADDLLDQQLDPYSFLKTAFETNRIDSLYDGQPPETQEDFDF